MAEGILAKHLPNYDHLSLNDLPRSTGSRVTAEWRDVAAHLDEMSPEEAREAPQLSEPWHEGLSAEILQHRTEIAGMLNQLADACDHFFEEQEWVCILGV